MTESFGTIEAPDPWFRREIKRGNGIFDRDSYEMCMRRVEDFRTAIDCGAHVGSWAMPMAQVFDTVYAFEPYPGNFNYLGSNSRHQKNLKIYNIAVGDVEGTIGISPGTENSGQWHIDDSGRKVNMIPLDSMFDEISDVDFIKIDVEGYELPVLQGAKKLIDRDNPVIMLEMNGLSERYNYTDRDLRDYVVRIGYKQVAAQNKDFLFARSG
jgi:FkbM family methyltransferase